MKLTYITVLFSSLVLISNIGRANMAYSPWVHEAIQNGKGMEITVQVFDETTAVNTAEEPLPGFNGKYTLTRYGSGDDGTTAEVFKERTFSPAEADAVTEYSCQPWDLEFQDAGECASDMGDCEDCDSDGKGECFGFCGKAYRYKVIDSCPPADQDLMYQMTVTPTYDLVEGSGEGLGFTTTTFSSSKECTASKSAGGACSAVDIGGQTTGRTWFQSMIFVLFF